MDYPGYTSAQEQEQRQREEGRAYDHRYPPQEQQQQQPRYDPDLTASPRKRAAEESESTSQAGAARAKPKAKASNGAGKSKKEKEGDAPGPRRAAQACLRCRRQKLKCIGGWPCDRCQKSKNECDFGRPGMMPPREGHQPAPGSSEANARLEQLESSVANLLAGLASAPQTSYPKSEALHALEAVRRESLSANLDRKPSFPPPPEPSFNPNIPPPTHTRHLDHPRMGVGIGYPSTSASPDDIPQHHVRFTSSPHQTFVQHGYSPSNFSSNGTGPSPASTEAFPREEKKRPHSKMRQRAEERLATATEADYDEPPFKPLVYQPAVWDNREASRRNSPQPSQSSQSRDDGLPGTYSRQFMRARDDPVTTEIISRSTAIVMFDFYVQHCHPFLPVVNVSLENAFDTISQSPFLISSMIAIAGRFYIKYTNKNPSTSLPPIDSSVPHRLANLAESHLGATLLRKQHALSDVQAVLLLSAWGLQSGGRGPDAWIITGHAARIARRLGVHKNLATAAELSRTVRPGGEGWDKLEAFMPQWRTWLAWFTFDGFLSLGFGRPQSTQFETVDESGFLQIRLNQSPPRPGTTHSMSLYGDVYIAGQVQLTQVGRDLISWGEMLADPRRAAEAEKERETGGRDMSVRGMFKELNGRLDEWCKLWVYANSPNGLYLGSSARIARLQADHMRLCLNSFALKSSPEKDEFVSECLRKALNAAMATIQTHHESSVTDMALSFATDYLTITLAQSAIFLVRIAKSSTTIQQILNIDPSVIAHYLKLSTTLLEDGELSETRVGTYLAKTIRDIARAGGITGLGGKWDEWVESRPASRAVSPRGRASASTSAHPPNSADSTTPAHPLSNSHQPPPLTDPTQPPDLAFEMNNLLAFESQFNLDNLLGLPGDDMASASLGGMPIGMGASVQMGLGGVPPSASPSTGGAGGGGMMYAPPGMAHMGEGFDFGGAGFNEFGFGMGGVAMGYGGGGDGWPPNDGQ
ncbi:hypothetical protein L202_06311 [Cryptococcus amylolentus CBS 6039]|uniref:Zn(2)-C6 fungal-type domain-containing protein n=1 Tax=Cryptococcus amylolentus CBS 6039 TaxID=1295533 RepID=A0A1E3HG45_9TREE|nr:hypothetical protein L202_06311 [Cryptococcus amylolentus CBS 6039]ODN75095.1 hypothetical protein L202_06311 [Cryptococcus amylolentus CBS 6039]